MVLSTIELSSTGTRGAITLNRPDKLNPLSTATLHELIEAARHFDSKPEANVVVVGRAGRAFTAGADLSAFAPGDKSRPSAGAVRKRPTPAAAWPRPSSPCVLSP